MNGGDDALKKFFKRAHDVLEPGGTFVLEPQAWDTYAKAKRMDNVSDSRLPDADSVDGDNRD